MPLIKKIKPYLPLSLILGAAFLLRLINILQVGDFAWDEMFSFTFSRLPWSQSWHLWLLETNPPLHLIILKLWFYIFPKNELFSRLPSLIFGLTNIWLIYLLGKKYFSRKIGLLGALLLTLTPYHIFLSGFARGYALLLLLVTAIIYFFLKILTEEKIKSRDYIILSVVNLLAFFTHLTAVLIILGQFLILLKKSKQLKKWLIYNLPAGILALCWLIPSLYGKLQNPAEFGTAWFFNFDKNISGILTPLKLIFLGPGHDFYVFSLGLIFVIFLSQQIITQIKKQKINPAFFITLIFFALPILNALVLKLWNIKFFIISLIPLTLLAVYLINSYIKNIYLKIILIIALTLPGLYSYHRLLPLSNWQQLNNTIIARSTNLENTVLITNNFVDELLLKRYFTPPIATQTYFPAGYTPLHKDYVTKNYLHYQRSREEIYAWLAERNIEKYGTVFVLQEDAFGVDLVEYLKTEPLWRQGDELYIRLADPRKLIIYERNR